MNTVNKAKVGLIGIVGEESKQDFWGTMQKVAGMGYLGLEAPGGLSDGNTAENLKRFHDLGLRVLTVSASRESLRDSLDALVAEAKALQSPRVSMWWGPCETKEQVLRDAELYNSAGARLASEGITLCYHNHEHEFQTAFDGVYALDVLAEHADPAALSFELDIAWITFGGEDPVRVLKRYAGRVPAIHVKDLSRLDERGHFTAVGTGVVPVLASVETALEAGIEWVVIEQDTLRHLTGLETAAVSILNLREMGLA